MTFPVHDWQFWVATAAALAALAYLLRRLIPRRRRKRPGHRAVLTVGGMPLHRRKP